ncbi:MAG: endonuclease/exonuclease/phosphatase family protein [Bacteroidales bacterium]|nr:endonuclease/exonuclease/phosphatase family protein [Bacteroidales bacterium]
MNRIFTLITGVLLLPAALLAEEPRTKVADDELKVLCYNIRSDIDGKFSDGDNSWCYRQEASYAMFKEIAPDVCGMQEARPHQLYDMEAAFPKYRRIGVGRDDGRNKGEHAAIMFNRQTIKLLDWGTYWLSETPDIPSKGWDASYPRTATWAKMRHIPSGKEFFIVNTHLDHRGQQAQRNGLALVRERIAAMNPENLPLILMGDFNMLPDNPCLLELDKEMDSARNVAEDSDTKNSYNGWGNGRDKILDYIYYTVFSSCPQFRVIDKTYKNIPYISDHYPIYTILKF